MDLSENLGDDYPETISVAAHMPVDPGAPVLKPDMRKIRHITGIVLRNLSLEKREERFQERVRKEDNGVVSTPSSGITNGKESNTQSTRSTKSTKGTESTKSMDRYEPSYSPVSSGPNTSISASPNIDTLSVAVPVAATRNDTMTRRRSRRSASLQASFPELSIQLDPEVELHMDEKLLDTMVVMYTKGQEQPIYISEVIEDSINPEFREIDFTKLEARTNTEVTVDIYCRSKHTDEPSKVVSRRFGLKDLLFIGRTMDSIDFSFDFNSIIIMLKDGCYTLEKAKGVNKSDGVVARDLPNTLLEIPSASSSPSTGNGALTGTVTKSHRHTASASSRVSSKSSVSVSFDQLLKIRNLEDCIADSHTSIDEVCELINTILSDQHNFTILYEKKSLLQHKLKILKDGIQLEKQKHGSIGGQIEKLHEQLSLRREIMKINKEATIAKNNQASQLLAESASVLAEVKSINQGISKVRAHVAATVQQIFPIDSAEDGKPLQFTICNVALPDIVIGQSPRSPSEVDEDEIDAAYGFVTQLTLIMAFYLDVPLRYPIQPYGSLSFVIDPISKIQGSRMFPLWIKSSLFYRFEYGVYLLHKDIEQLLNSQQLVVSDSRHTLANLKNLLLVVTAV